MIQPRDIAEMVVFLLLQPGNIDLAEITVRRFDPAAKAVVGEAKGNASDSEGRAGSPLPAA